MATRAHGLSELQTRHELSLQALPDDWDLADPLSIAAPPTLPAYANAALHATAMDSMFIADSHAADHATANGPLSTSTTSTTTSAPTPPLDGQLHTETDGTSYAAVNGFSNVNGDPVTHAVFSPPDNALAISGHTIVSAVNDTISWLKGDVSAASSFQSEAFSQFFPSAMVGKMYFTDPQVLYDAARNDYVVVEELYAGGNKSNASSLLVAVSHSDGAGWTDMTSFNADWSFYKINTVVKTTGGQSSAIDFPQAALDNQNLYISGDQFAGSSYVGNSLTVVGLDQLAGTGSGATLSVTPKLTHNVMTMDVAAGSSGAYFVGYEGKSDAIGDYVTIAQSDATSGTGMSAPVKVHVGQIDNLSVSTLTATEPSGHLIDASDRRVIDAKLVDGDLFAVTEIAAPDGTPLMHWFEFDVGKLASAIAAHSSSVDGAMVAEGDVKLGAGIATYNGSIAGDSAGNLVLNFAASGANLAPTDYYEVHRATDPAGIFEQADAYAASPTSYSDGLKVSRWGDYSSAVVDPNGGFLISNEYAVDASHWGTAIGHVLLA